MNNNKLYEQVLPIYEAHYINKELKGNDGSYIGVVVVGYKHENGIETLKIKKENKEDNNIIISIPVYDIIS